MLLRLREVVGLFSSDVPSGVILPRPVYYLTAPPQQPASAQAPVAPLLPSCPMYVHRNRCINTAAARHAANVSNGFAFPSSLFSSRPSQDIFLDTHNIVQ